MPKRFSTVRGREFGGGLREAIAAAGFSSRALAERVDWDEAKLSGLVNGKGGVSDVELGVLLGLCGVSPVERDHLLSLFSVAHVKSWLQEHGTCPPVYHRTCGESRRGQDVDPLARARVAGVAADARVHARGDHGFAQRAQG
jgi:hypothetical protein